MIGLLILPGSGKSGGSTCINLVWKYSLVAVPSHDSLSQPPIKSEVPELQATLLNVGVGVGVFVVVIVGVTVLLGVIVGVTELVGVGVGVPQVTHIPDNGPLVHIFGKSVFVLITGVPVPGLPL